MDVESASTANLSAHLSRVAARSPSRNALICHAGHDRDGNTVFRHWTFLELDLDADRLAHVFQRIGISRGTKTILMIRPSYEFFCVTFALMRVGAVPVMIDPGMGRRRLVDNLSSIGAEAFIGIPVAHVLRVMSPRRFPTVKVSITVGRRFFWGGYSLRDLLREPWRPFASIPSRPDETAAIFFTTGSTGPPKGVVYERSMLETQIGYLTSHFGYRETDIDLATFPLFSLFDIASGITCVIPDMDPTKPGSSDPRKIVEAIRVNKCTSLYGSPALLENLAAYGQETGTKLPTLRRITTAGAPVRPALLEALHAMLPDDARIHTPYGATEVLPVSSIDSREILATTRRLSESGSGTCVGRPMEGVQIAIIAITDEPLPYLSQAVELGRREIGEIIVKGPVVTKQYFRRPAATKLSKIIDERDNAIWHRMGDVGYLDELGRLWFCGRKAHRVQTAQATLFTIPCEAIFNRHPRVRRSALVGIGEASDQRPVMIIELKSGDGREDRGSLTAELLALGRGSPLTESIQTIVYHPGFPVDIRHNAKISREKLAVWAGRALK